MLLFHVSRDYCHEVPATSPVISFHLNENTKTPDMRPILLPLPVALSIFGYAYSFQIPFLSAPDKHPGEHNTISASTPTTPVTSSALQQLINPDNLFRRAEQLFEIAKLSIGEYGHPTRVIGSKGASYSFNYPLLRRIASVSSDCD